MDSYLKVFLKRLITLDLLIWWLVVFFMVIYQRIPGSQQDFLLRENDRKTPRVFNEEMDSSMGSPKKTPLKF